ncbi:hypothetical protein Q9189_005500 [Teloschistes chrysophthalmus]
MKDQGVVVYTLYAKFFNAVATACNGQNWVLFDPTSRKGTNRGLKLTTQRREKMNQMVGAANQQIRTAIGNSRSAFEARGIPILVADWDEYVGKIDCRFCEEGASANPDDDLSLVFQRQDNTPQFIPPERLLAGNMSEPHSRVTAKKSAELPERSFLPDDYTHVFHPNFLGHSIIAQIVLSEITKSRATRLSTERPTGSCTLGEGQFHSECGIYSFKLTDPTPKFPPGPDSVDSAGSLVEPVCFTKQNQYIQQSDLDAAISSYCDNDGKPFFKGDKQISHAVSTGPETHIYTEGTDISKQTITYYKYDDVCK